MTKRAGRAEGGSGREGTWGCRGSPATKETQRTPPLRQQGWRGYLGYKTEKLKAKHTGCPRQDVPPRSQPRSNA